MQSKLIIIFVIALFNAPSLKSQDDKAEKYP